MQSMAAIVLVTFVWVTVGFTISFGEGSLWFGNWEYTFLNHVGSRHKKILARIFHWHYLCYSK